MKPFTPGLLLLAVLPLLGGVASPAQTHPPANLALVATASTSFVSGHETITALNDGSSPAHSDDKSRGACGNWSRTGTQWVQYDWPQTIQTDRVEVYWFDDQRGVRLPRACRLLYWDGSAFAPVKNVSGLGLEANRFNVTTFPAITTTRLRLEMDGRDTFSTGLLEWRVLDAGGSPNFAPAVNGKRVKPRLEAGYAVLHRKWRAGDRIELELPLAVQRITASEQIVANRSHVVFRFGPLIYNFESVDQNLDAVLSASAPLATEWRGGLLGGVVVIKGSSTDGKPLLAVPNFARLNRGGRSIVWIRAE